MKSEIKQINVYTPIHKLEIGDTFVYGGKVHMKLSHTGQDNVCSLEGNKDTILTNTDVLKVYPVAVDNGVVIFDE